MSNEKSAELTKPGVGALYDPASLVAPEFASIFVAPELAVLAIWNDEVDAALFEPLAQQVGVVGAVGDHAFRLLPRTAFGSRDFDFGERGFRKRNFSRRGTFEPNSSGRPPPSTSTIHFVPLPRLVLPTAEPLFLPERNCHPGTSLPTSAALRHPGHPAAFARRQAKHPALPTASTAANRLLEKDICRARISMPHPFVAPKGCPPDRPGWMPTDGLDCPCAAWVRAAVAQSAPTAHRSTTRIASCSCKKKIKPPASGISP